jgi:hypothetical protein
MSAAFFLGIGVVVSTKLAKPVHDAPSTNTANFFAVAIPRCSPAPAAARRAEKIVVAGG